MSTLDSLRGAFQVIEMVAFQEWKDATPERREEITRALGELEARMILQKIDEEVKALYPEN